MSTHCEDCGTKLDRSRCPNCQEELVIYEDQYEYMQHPISDEFRSIVREQKSKSEKEE